MNPELLQKYIAGNATEAEKQRVTKWIQENPENMREYMAQRKLHDMVLWRTEPVAEENSRERKHFSLRGVCMEAAKIAAVLAIVLLGTHYWTGKHQVPEDKTWQSIYVPAGQRAELMLADGTKVWLNSRSTLTFPGSFKGNIRNVKLDGEGYFAVTKNVEQPFIVETNKCNVKVLGTEFNVMAYAADSVWETSLLEGAVEILVPGSNNSGMRLEPNMMASLKGNRLVKGRIKEADYFLWREGLLCFNDISVRDMIEKLKLYYGVDIVVNNTRILKNRYTGKFRTKDGVEHVLKVLKLNNKFTYTKDDETNVITIN
jgi:transmembrane sensor